MRNLILLSLLFLTGCAAHQAQSQITQMAKAEFSAWETANNMGNAQCPKGTDAKPIPRSKSLEHYDCWEKIHNEYVAPVVMAPDLYMQYMTGQKELAIGYKNGRIDRDEANLKGQRLWNEYYAALDARARNAVMNAQKQDQAFAQRLGNASQEIQRQEAVAAQSNTVKNTNCQVFKGTMNCTTW